MQANSKAIITNQQGVHEHLEQIVTKHQQHQFLKPIAEHTRQAFEEVNNIVQQHKGDVILDACCGVGQSTRILAKQHPDCLVIGVDKSLDRISRNVDDKWQVENYQLLRADLNDFYRLLQQANWPIKKHFILYPNPWPKNKHIQRRWHGAAVFPYIMATGSTITLRSNWRIYLEEFLQAAQLYHATGQITELAQQLEPLTPFEAKFQASGQTCWELVISTTDNS